MADTERLTTTEKPRKSAGSIFSFKRRKSKTSADEDDSPAKEEIEAELREAGDTDAEADAEPATTPSPGPMPTLDQFAPPPDEIIVPRNAKLQRKLARATDTLSQMRNSIPPAIFLHVRALLIGRQHGGGFLFSMSGGHAIMLRRLPGGGWSLPLPVRILDYSIGLVVGGFTSHFIALVLDEDFRNAILGDGVVQLHDGVVGYYASPAQRVKFRNHAWGSSYTDKRGFMGAVAYRHYDLQPGSMWSYYPKNVTLEDVLDGRAVFDGDCNSFSLYQLLNAIDDDGRDPEYQ